MLSDSIRPVDFKCLLTFWRSVSSSFYPMFHLAWLRFKRLNTIILFNGYRERTRRLWFLNPGNSNLHFRLGSESALDSDPSRAICSRKKIKHQSEWVPPCQGWWIWVPWTQNYVGKIVRHRNSIGKSSWKPCLSDSFFFCTIFLHNFWMILIVKYIIYIDTIYWYLSSIKHPKQSQNFTKQFLLFFFSLENVQIIPSSISLIIHIKYAPYQHIFIR